MFGHLMRELRNAWETAITAGLRPERGAALRTRVEGLVRRSSFGSEGGSALIAATLVVVAVAGLTAAFLVMVITESKETQKSILSQQTFFAAESGINTAINDINTANIDANKDGLSDVDGHALGNVMGTLVMTRDSANNPVVTLYANTLPSAVPTDSGQVLGAYNVAAVYIPPVYTVNPDVPDAGTDLYTITSAADDGSTATRAAVQTQATRITRPLFQMAMFGDLKVTLSGTVFIDSYNSNNGNYDAQDVNFDPVSGKNYANTNGDVGSNHDISIGGTTNVFGDVMPGPTGSLSISGGGVNVSGSTANAPEEIPLEPVVYNPPIAAAGSLSPFGGGANPPPYVMASGTYRYTDITMSGKAKISIPAGANVTIYLDNGLTMGAQNAIAVDPTAKVRIISNGDIKLAGQGIAQGTFAADGSLVTDPTANPYAGNFRLDVTSGHNVAMTGTSDFYGVVYAPDTTVKFSGTSKFFGAVIGDTVSDFGTQDFHYDERLGNDFVTPTTYYRVRGWMKMDDMTSVQNQFPAVTPSSGGSAVTPVQ